MFHTIVFNKHIEASQSNQQSCFPSTPWYLGWMDEQDIIAAQCRAARALLNWSQKTLAAKARVGIVTVQNFEGEKTEPVAGTRILIRQAFERGGIEFIPEDGGGSGLRFKKRK
jgi:DNA-binding XRE family transcriptional regulator